jgi:hypothetical protein
MSQKPSLKKAKLAIQKSVLVLSKEEYSQLHESVIIPFEQAIDNVRNNDELFYDISENLISIFGLKPSYAMFQLCREETKKALMESKKITETTFKNHYWKYVRDFLDINKDFTFPKSNSVDAIKKQAQREKALSLTKNDGTLKPLIEISDEDLSAGLFGSKGKKALIDREDASKKASDDLQKKARKANSDNFLARMKKMVNEKYDLAMYIEGKLGDYENDFNAEKN